VALVTLLLVSGDSAADRLATCAEAGAPSFSDGFMPNSTGFESIEEAEAFICHEIVYPRATGGWIIEHVSASRSRPAADIVRGIGFASVTLDYGRIQGGADLRIEVSPFRIDPVLYGIVDRIEIMGAQANVIQGKDPSLFIVQWEANGFSFYTEARLAASFGLPDLYTILNSIR
jgi:hypothetical protein